MAVNDYYRLIVEYTFNEVDIYRNTLAYQLEVAISGGGEAQALVEDWYNDVQVAFASMLPASWAVVGVRSRGLTDPTVGYDGTTRFNGSRAGNALPPNVTGILDFKTGFIGRSYQGRNQLPAPVEADQENGILTLDWVNDALAYGDALNVVHDAATGLIDRWKHVVWSDKLNTGTPVTAYLARGVTGGQDTRKTGRGS